MALVSVIMPAYNVAPYVGAAVDSVLAQTTPDWELLVTDDGSTDGTAAIVREYAARDPRIRLLQQRNGGLSSARNCALRAARGEFLAILDSDDLWEPGFLEAQLDILAGDPSVDIVTGNAFELGGRRHGAPARPWPDPRPQPTLIEILRDEEAVFIMSVMRRRVYDTIGAFDEVLRTNEDYHFWLRAAIAGFRFRRNDRPLGHYRRRDNSLSASELRMLEGILIVYERIRPLLAGRSDEMRVLRRQVARFERERIAARARLALDSGDPEGAAAHLSELSGQGGGRIVKLASLMARWTPGLLSRAYHLRRARQEAAS